MFYPFPTYVLLAHKIIFIDIISIKQNFINFNSLINTCANEVESSLYYTPVLTLNISILHVLGFPKKGREMKISFLHHEQFGQKPINKPP